MGGKRKKREVVSLLEKRGWLGLRAARRGGEGGGGKEGEGKRGRDMGGGKESVGRTQTGALGDWEGQRRGGGRVGRGGHA